MAAHVLVAGIPNSVYLLAGTPEILQPQPVVSADNSHVAAAGLDPDDPEAAFVHAVLALAAGLAAKADEAIGRCADASTSWDRRARAVHLTELTAIRPDMAEGLARLRSIMAAAEKRHAARL